MKGSRYSTVAIVLHWLIALGIIVNIGLAWIWPLLSEDALAPLLTTHKSIGITILGLAIMRVLWRWGHRPPALPSSYGHRERTASYAVHFLLYSALFVMPISGWVIDSAWKEAASHPMHYFFLAEWPRLGFVMTLPPTTKLWLFNAATATHAYFAYILYGAFILHVAGALKHQWFDRERELQRMWFARKG